MFQLIVRKTGEVLETANTREGLVWRKYHSLYMPEELMIIASC